MRGGRCNYASLRNCEQVHNPSAGILLRKFKYSVLQEKKVLQVTMQMVHIDDGVDIKGPKCCMVVTNKAEYAMDFFVKLIPKDSHGPNFFCPVKELFAEVPAAQ